MRYVVIGHKTEQEARGSGKGEVLSYHYTLIDAVKSCLRYVNDGPWFSAFVAKIVK